MKACQEDLNLDVMYSNVVSPAAISSMNTKDEEKTDMFKQLLHDEILQGMQSRLKTFQTVSEYPSVGSSNQS